MRGHRWRLTLPFAGQRGEQDPTLAEIQRLTSQRAPRPVTVSDPTWLASFRCHRRSASAYRRGRVLLAGDAVHIHSPAGGQGLNTGILDAHNLAWKLALVASGRAPDALLDTYAAERRPVAEDVLRFTHGLVHYSTLSHPAKRMARDLVAPALARSAAIQRRAARRISQIYVRYPSGPCEQERYGTVCAPAGTGRQGSACGSTEECAAGYACIITGAGTTCGKLCVLGQASSCPEGQVCEPIDVAGYATCF